MIVIVNTTLVARTEESLQFMSILLMVVEAFQPNA